MYVNRTWITWAVESEAGNMRLPKLLPWQGAKQQQEASDCYNVSCIPYMGDLIFTPKNNYLKTSGWFRRYILVIPRLLWASRSCAPSYIHPRVARMSSEPAISGFQGGTKPQFWSRDLELRFGGCLQSRHCLFGRQQQSLDCLTMPNSGEVSKGEAEVEGKYAASHSLLVAHGNLGMGRRAWSIKLAQYGSSRSSCFLQYLV